MRVKYNKELASELINGKVKGAFYRRTEDGEEQVFPELITYKDEDLICLKRTHKNPFGETMSIFKTLTEGIEDTITIELSDFKVGSLVAVDIEDGTLVGVLSEIRGTVIQTSCFSGLEKNDILQTSEHPFCEILDSRRPSHSEMHIFLDVVDKNGFYLGKGNQLCKKEKSFEPFEKVIVYAGVWRGDFFSHIEGDYYITTSTRRLKEDEIKSYKGNEHLIGTKCD